MIDHVYHNAMNKLFALTVAHVMLFFAPMVFSQTIEQLISDKSLTINVSIENSENSLVKQPLLLNVEIATQRWFAKGTRIIPFSLANTVMLNDSVLSINGAKNVNGITWVTQLKQITLYPTKSGRYTLPPIEVFISVNTEKYGVVEGTIKTPSRSFKVTQPAELDGIDEFVVSSQFTLAIDSDFEPNSTYQIGDAITQSLHFKTLDAPGMMIPELNFTTPSGLSIYRKPAKVFDQSSRGTLVGNRVETYSYIIEKEGDYHIDEQKINWWDSKNNQLKVITLPSINWQVGPNLPVKQGSHLSFFKKVIVQNPRAVIVLTLCFLFLCFLYQRRVFLTIYYKKITKYEQRKAAKAFLMAMNQQDYPLACQKLYLYAQVVNPGISSLKAYYLLDDATGDSNLQKLERLYHLAGLSGSYERAFLLTKEEINALLAVNKSITKPCRQIKLGCLDLNR